MPGLLSQRALVIARDWDVGKLQAYLLDQGCTPTAWLIGGHSLLADRDFRHWLKAAGVLTPTIVFTCGETRWHSQLHGCASTCHSVTLSVLWNDFLTD